MKFYVYASTILITAVLLLAGCARQSTGNASASTEKAETEGSKTSQQAAQADPADISGDRATAVTVYKSPTCGCCSKWEEHLTKAGFKVSSKTTDDMEQVRAQFGVPEKMQSCHTAVIDGYVIEGHVPADDVKKLLETRPEGVAGLAAPGMPANSPGMQPEGEKPSGYDVLSFDREGNAKVFTSYK